MDAGPARRVVRGQVIAVKLEYGLSVDPAERVALEALLAGGGAQLSCVDADTTSPAVAISSDASAPVAGPFSIAIAFSEPVTGFELEDLVVGNGSASELQGNNATYTVTITPAASGTVTVDIAAGASQDSAGNPSVAADPSYTAAALTGEMVWTTPTLAGEPEAGPDDPTRAVDADAGSEDDPDGGRSDGAQSVGGAPGWTHRPPPRELGPDAAQVIGRRGRRARGPPRSTSAGEGSSGPPPRRSPWLGAPPRGGRRLRPPRSRRPRPTPSRRGSAVR